MINNKKRMRSLRLQFHKNPNVHIIGFTRHVAEYMAAADVLFTKPGGLSSTEAAVRRVPLVHTDPIPGCETANMSYFVRHGYSITAKTSEGQVAAGIRLAHDDSMRERMRENQRRDFKGDTSQKILQFIEKCR